MAEGFEEFGFRNTILCDNEIRKFRECIDNGILVPPFDEPQVIKEEESLKYVQEYLQELGKQYAIKPFDVREYMAAHPLKDDVYGSKSMARINYDRLEDQLLHEIQELKLSRERKSEEFADYYVTRFAKSKFRFEGLIDSEIQYVGPSATVISFQYKPGLVLMSSMDLKTLWDMIQDASPRMVVVGKYI
jgi:hypothetical protein